MKLRRTLLFLTILCSSSLGVTLAAPPEESEQMVITSVDIDYEFNEIYIYGSNFDNGVRPERTLNPEWPVVTLGGYPVTGIKVDPGHIKGTFSEPPFITDGDYLLVVRTGPGRDQMASLSLTLGAVGPEGEQGIQGLQGEQGTQGEQGPAGADGSDGAYGAPGTPGSSGADGQDGSSCSVAKTDDTATISCEDGTVATVSDGAEGPAGEQGPQGPAEPSVFFVNELCTLYQVTGYPAPLSLVSESPEATCDDGLDNDCDGDVDIADSDCAPPVVCPCADAYAEAVTVYTAEGGNLADGWDSCAIGDRAFVDVSDITSMLRIGLTSFDPTVGGLSEGGCQALVTVGNAGGGGVFFQSVVVGMDFAEHAACTALQESICNPP